MPEVIIKSESTLKSLEEISVLLVDNTPQDIVSIIDENEYNEEYDVFKDIKTANSFTEANKLIPTNNFNVIICDYNIPNEDGFSTGLDFLVYLAKKYINIILFLYTGYPTVTNNNTVRKLASQHNINIVLKTKPVSELMFCISRKINQVNINETQTISTGKNIITFINELKHKIYEINKQKLVTNQLYKIQASENRINLPYLNEPNEVKTNNVLESYSELAKPYLDELYESRNNLEINHFYGGEKVDVNKLIIDIETLSPTGIEHINNWLRAKIFMDQIDNKL